MIDIHHIYLPPQLRPGHGQQRIKQPRQPGPKPRQPHARHRHGVKTAKPKLGSLAQGQSRGFDPDHHIIFLVLMGVNGVIAQSPEQPRPIQRHCGQGDLAPHRRPSQQRPPIEGQSQPRLRPMGDALHQRIRKDQQQRRHPHPNGKDLELHQHGQPHRQLRRQKNRRLPPGNLVGGDGTILGPLDPRIEIPVGDVVDGAARPPHHHRPDGEQQRIFNQRPIKGRCRQHQTPPAWKQQQPGTDGPVHPHQPHIGTPRRGCRPQGPMIMPNIGNRVAHAF